MHERHGTFFIVHADMFACPDANGRWMAPEGLLFFEEHRHADAKKLSDSIISDFNAKAGLKADVVINAPAAAASDGDSRKLPSKSEAARVAKERYSVDLVLNRSRRNIDQQFLAAHCSHQFGGDGQAAVSAAASAELDQLPAAA